MKKLKLQPLKQKSKNFYICVCDPREIVKYTEINGPNTSQEAQRPWEPRKVMEIAKYVGGKIKLGKNGKPLMGILPTNIVLGMKTEKYPVQSDNGEYFIELPDVPEPIFVTLDGQHRLIAFREEQCMLNSNVPYEMAFTIFEPLSLAGRQELFLTTNEKQDRVQPNLLRYLKKVLGLLDEDDDTLYEIVRGLHQEDFSPLKGRIILGSDKVKHGLQEKQISKLLIKSGILQYYHQNICKPTRTDSQNQEKAIIAISNYLKAFQKVFNFNYSIDTRHKGAKMCGLRYALYLFQSCCLLVESSENKANTDSFIEILNCLPEATGIENVFTNETCDAAFRGETATINLAKKHGELLVKKYNERNRTFDAFDDI